jgi:hypothetical protein
VKPHLFRADGEWWCCAGGNMGRGATPFQAWMSWLTIGLSRYDFEGTA